MATEKTRAVKECPFCGVTPVVTLEMEDDERSQFEFSTVMCKSSKCLVNPTVGSTMGKGKSIDAALRRWNIRNA